MAEVPFPKPCIFCEILAGRAEGSVVLRDEVCAVFVDIRPVNEGHLLVVPIEHGALLDELPASTASHLMMVARRVGSALRASSLRCDGFNLLLADGEAAGQEVFHCHLHVIPRFGGDGFGFRFAPDHGRLPPREELDRVAGEVGRHLEG